MDEIKRDGLADWLAENSERILTGVLAMAVLATIAVAGAYIAHFGGEPLAKTGDVWGQFGDYLGGVLNPVFGFLSVFALLVALVLQTRELKLSRESLKLSQEELKLTREEQAKSAQALSNQNKVIQKQSFEQTFFAWLGSYRQILDEVGDTHGAGGRKALYGIWNSNLNASRIHRNMAVIGGSSQLVRALGSVGVVNFGALTLGHYPIIAQAAKAQWDSIYDQHESDLGSFFRVLYRLLKWIDEQPELQMSQEDKRLYVGIVRSQLSWIEMVFLFYNGMTERGAKFKPLIERYALFDNLTINSDKLLFILKECPMDAVGYAPGAYNSDLARESEKTGDQGQAFNDNGSH